MKTFPTSLLQIEKRIALIQRQLAQLGPLRPGSLSQQYQDPKNKKGPYYQLSYTFQMRSRTEYVSVKSVPQIRRELATYQRYKELNQEWIELSIQQSRLKLKAAKQQSTKKG